MTVTVVEIDEDATSYRMQMDKARALLQGGAMDWLTTALAVAIGEMVDGDRDRALEQAVFTAP